MKKSLHIILSLVLAAVMLAPLSLSVAADMGAPEIKPYDVVVNPGGTYTKDGDFIPEGTVLTFRFELMEDGVTWGWTDYSGTKVNIADVTNGDTIPEEAGTQRDRDSHFEVFGADEIDVYAGPGHAYNVLFSVPCGERIGGDHWVVDWVYVRYGEQGGWICPRSTDVVYAHDKPVTVWTVAETPLLKDSAYTLALSDADFFCMIPADTKLDSYLSDTNFYSLFYVTYGEYSGWVDCFRNKNAVSESKYYYKSSDDGTLYLYDLPFDYEKGYFEPVRTLETKKDDIFRVVFAFNSHDYVNIEWLYLETDGASGWTPVIESYYEGDKSIYPYASDILGYIVMTDEEYSEIIAAQSHDEQSPDKQAEDVTETPTEPETDESAKETEPEEEKSPAPEKPTEKRDKADGFFSSPTAVIVFCVVCAVVLALVAAVVLTMIKKKKAK